jgi:hypothetical protein
LGENKYGSVTDISALRRYLAVSGDLISEDEGSFTRGLTEEIWSGISFPPEKSSSAGSMPTGSSSRNSNSLPESSGSGPSGGFLAGDEDLAPASLEPSPLSGYSQLNETLGLSQP